MKKIISLLVILHLLSSATARAAQGNITIIEDVGHGAPTAQRFVIEGLRQALQLDRSSNCLFVELSPTVNPYAEAYLRGASYDNSIVEWAENREKIIGSKTYNIVPEGLLQVAAKNHMKIFGVDVEADTKRFQDVVGKKIIDNKINETYVRVVVESRNQTMPAEIARLIQNRTCNSGVLIVGAGHTLSFSSGFAVKPIQAFLSEMGLNVQIMSYPKELVQNEKSQPIERKP